LPITSSVTEHDALAAIDPPDSVTVVPPAFAVADPPHVEVRFTGLATTTPAGNVSVKLTPVSATPALGLAIEIVRVDLPPGVTLLPLNDFVTVGGAPWAMSKTIVRPLIALNDPSVIDPVNTIDELEKDVSPNVPLSSEP